MRDRHRVQISVPLDPDLRAFVERQAAREERTLAQVVRRLIAAAARSSSSEAAR
jgi:hypothetical protein